MGTWNKKLSNLSNTWICLIQDKTHLELGRYNLANQSNFSLSKANEDKPL